MPGAICQAAIPSGGDPPNDLRVAEELRGLEHQLIEVDQIALLEKALVAVEDVAVARVLEGGSAETMCREAGEQAAVPTRWDGEPSEDGALLAFVDDAEPPVEPDAVAELAQQIGAEGVDRARLDRRGAET